MKTSLLAGLIIVAGLSLVSFSPTKKEPLSIAAALAEKKIAITIIAKGGHSGNSIDLRVTNLASGPLSLVLPVGTLFVPDDAGEQTLISTEAQQFALEKKQERTIHVNAFCTEAHDHSPSTSSTFKMATSPNPSLVRLVTFMDSLKIVDESAIQSSIWCLTDSESVSYVYTGDPKASKMLRSFLCGITGQKDTWYNTERELVVNEQHEIVRIPKEIKGNIAFSATEPVELQGVVKDSTGKILVTNPHKTNLPAGNVKFEFKLKIEGWAPGNYSVVYTNNGKEVINQPFTI